MFDDTCMKYVRYTSKPPDRCPPFSGLLHYRKWWEQNEVEICVCGKLISGTPIFVEKDTLRVVNSQHSYFIPLEKIDYIRTTDGLRSSFDLPGPK